jgi:fructose-1,6-bisphosphatase I
MTTKGAPTFLEGTEAMTLTRYVLVEQRRHKEAQGDLTLLLSAVQLACKVIESCVRRAGIAKLYGLAGDQNVQGEDQKKLDVIANDTFKLNLIASEKCACLVSEEEELAILVDPSLRGRYAVAFDPLDGSSNIDANVSIGTIFAIYHIDNPQELNSPQDVNRYVLQSGRSMVAAGYAMYGSATNLVFSTGETVNGFTLDPSLGEFVLTHPNMRCPRRGTIYSINEGNSRDWDPAVREFVQRMKHPDKGKPRSLRYIGSMVADVHRTLLYGGVFMYPADSKSKEGKLRYLYEAAPMAFLMEVAGGRATTGKEDILDVVPRHIHQRVPVFMGSAEDIEEFMEIARKTS